MREQFRSITTNLTPVRVVGIPGLALVLIAIALAVQFPEARWLLVAGLAGGIVIAAFLVIRRATDAPDDGAGRRRGILLGRERPSPGEGARSSRPRSGDGQSSYRPAVPIRAAAPSTSAV